MNQEAGDTRRALREAQNAVKWTLFLDQPRDVLEGGLDGNLVFLGRWAVVIVPRVVAVALTIVEPGEGRVRLALDAAVGEVQGNVKLAVQAEEEGNCVGSQLSVSPGRPHDL